MTMLRPTLQRLARGRTRRPSPARKAFRPCPSLDGLEPRLVPAAHVSIIGGVLTAQADNTFTTVSVGHVVQAGKGFAVINGHSFSDAAYNSIRINGGTGGLQANILANVKPLTVFGVGKNNVVDLGDGTNHLQGIQGTVLLENETGSSVVNIDDQGDTTARTVTVSTVARPGDTSLGQVSGLGAAQITWDYHDTAAVNLSLGVGASTVNVQGTGVTTNVFNSANAAINVGSAGSVAGIQGALHLENETAKDTVSINDQSDATTRTVSVSTLARAGDTSLGAVTGLGAAQITWDYHDTSAVNLNLGRGASTVDVLGTGVTTNVFNSANATINVGSGGSVAGIQGALHLENETAKDTVNINDQGDATTRTVTVSTLTRAGDTSLGAVSGLGAAQITWDYHDTSAVNLNLGNGASTVDVLGTGVTTNVFNSANAAINVGSGGSVAGIQGALHLENETAKDTVNINDQSDATTRTVTMSTLARAGDSSLGAVNGLGAAQITWDYADTSVVNLNLGKGASTVNVNGTGPLTTNVLITAPNAKVDVGNFQTAANIQGHLNLLTEASGARVGIGDNDDTQGQTATLTTVTRSNQSPLGRLTGLGSGVITWDSRGTNEVIVVGGNGTNTFNIQGTVVPTIFDSNGPATMNVGSGGSIAGIQGFVGLGNNNGPQNTININSQNDSRTTTASLTIQPDPGSTLGSDFLTVPGLANEIGWANGDTSVVNINLGKGASTVDVLATRVTTNISITAPNAVVAVGNANAAANIQGKLNLLTEGSGAFVEIEDNSDTQGQTYTLATVSRPNQSPLGQLTGLGSGVITWDYRGTTGVLIAGGGGTNTVFIQGTVVDTTVNSVGPATVVVGFAGSIAGIQGGLLLSNTTGPINTIDINSQNDSRTTTVSLTDQVGATGVFSAPGLANKITWVDGSTAQLNLGLGKGASTVDVLGTGVFTNVFTQGNATINVGNNGFLSGIHGSLNLDDRGSDTIFLDNSSDDVGETFNFNVFAGVKILNEFGELSGTAMSGSITWNNTATSGVNLFGGSGGDTYNIFATGGATSIFGGFGANTFNVNPSSTGVLGTNIVGTLTLDGGGNAGTGMNLNDLGDPNSETFNFAISTPGNGSLGLGSTPTFNMVFDAMNFVDLITNGFSTVNDPSGTVNKVS
jgi:hypothetical protein